MAAAGSLSFRAGWKAQRCRADVVDCDHRRPFLCRQQQAVDSRQYEAPRAKAVKAISRGKSVVGLAVLIYGPDASVAD